MVLGVLYHTHVTCFVLHSRQSNTKRVFCITLTARFVLDCEVFCIALTACFVLVFCITLTSLRNPHTAGYEGIVGPCHGIFGMFGHQMPMEFVGIKCQWNFWASNDNDFWGYQMTMEFLGIKCQYPLPYP